MRMPFQKLIPQAGEEEGNASGRQEQEPGVEQGDAVVAEV